MARAKKSKSKEKDEDAPKGSSRVPSSVKVFTFILVVLAIGGSIGVNFLKSTRGAVFLTDRGAVLAYARAQRDGSRILKRALESQHLRRNIRVTTDSGKPESKQALGWDIPCDETTDLLKVNVALRKRCRARGWWCAGAKNSTRENGWSSKSGRKLSACTGSTSVW